MKKILLICFVLLFAIHYANCQTIPLALDYNNIRPLVGKTIKDSATIIKSVGTGFKIIRFSNNTDSIFLATIKQGPGISMSYNLDSSITISASGSATPTPKARLVTATTDVIALDDNIIIYNGTAAATFTITAGSTQGRPLRISNNSAFAIKVGIYTIPAKSWREWVWISSINDWFQFQSGVVL